MSSTSFFCYSSTPNRSRMERLHLHRLRHTFATRYRSRGVGLEAIRELLGHKTMTMTRRYAKVTPEYLRDAVQQGGRTAPGSQNQNQEQTGSAPGMVKESKIVGLRYG